MIGNPCQMSELVISLMFWSSCLVVAYTYLGFPLCLFLMTRGKSRPVPQELPAGKLPSVSFLVCACNEEPVIEKKLRNCLDLDYPEDKLHFIFVADGSTDRTNQILSRYAGPRIRTLLRAERMGKINALKAGFAACDAEIIVFSDANTFYRPDALRKLLRHFSDPEVGVVTGDVRLLPSKEQFGEGEGLYYRYERYLQTLETAFWSIVSVDGGMYALRRLLLVPPSYQEVPDDFIIGMNVARQGFRMVYDPEAIAEEPPTPTSSQEFNRKVRIVAHGVQSILAREGAPHLRQGRLLWVYLSHKVLRWIVPVFLVAAFLSSAMLLPFSAWWTVPVLAQTGFYGLAVAGWRWQWNGRLFRVPYYFCMVNLAALRGILRGLRRAEKVLGVKTDRIAA